MDTLISFLLMDVPIIDSILISSFETLKESSDTSTTKQTKKHNTKDMHDTLEVFTVA